MFRVQSESRKVLDEIEVVNVEARAETHWIRAQVVPQETPLLDRQKDAGHSCGPGDCSVAT